MLDFFTFDLDQSASDLSTRTAANELPTVKPDHEGDPKPARSLLKEVGDLTELMLASCRKRQQESQKSRESQVAKFMALDPVARDAFEERSAILEYDAGLPREEAELKAFQMVVHAFPAP